MDEEPTYLEAAIQRKKDTANADAERAKLVAELTGGFGAAISQLSRDIVQEIRKGTRVTNFGDAPKIEAAPMPESVTVNAATVTGMGDLLSLVETKLDQIVDRMYDLKVTVPEITIPDITIPEAKVTVQFPKMPEPKVTVVAPEPKVIIREVAIPAIAPEREVAARLVEERPVYTKEGELDGFTELYSDGSTIKKTGLTTNRIKYEYGNI